MLFNNYGDDGGERGGAEIDEPQEEKELSLDDGFEIEI